MPLSPKSKEILKFLKNNPSVRGQIRAPHNGTLLYAGKLIRQAYIELQELKQTDAVVAEKTTLQDALTAIHLNGGPYRTLWQWATAIKETHDGDKSPFVVWRALSGIFASNATGAVSFYVGSGVSPEHKVFAATEIHVLARNPNIDDRTKDVLAYYQRCLQEKNDNMGFSFISANEIGD